MAVGPWRRARAAMLGAALLAVGAVGAVGGVARAAAPHRAAASPGPGASVPQGAVLEALGPGRLVVPGPPPAIGWPARGESAAGVQGVGILAGSPAQTPVPIASLTKLMTAYVVLEDHPLAPGASGPTVEMTAWDVADWREVVHEDGSNVEVRRGELLSERQLLEALLMPSADNIADALGVWDAGSDAAFVAKMNATARRLGLRATHYADDSGLAVRSRSDALDQVALASDLMEYPLVRRIVRQHKVAFPVVGHIWNLNPALGVDGIVGLKSGYTTKAGGCLAAAAWRDPGGHRALVVAVALGQPRGLAAAAKAAERVLEEASGVLEPVRVAAPGQVVARLRLPWSPTALPVRAPEVASRVVAWPGLVLTERLVPLALAALADEARRAGTAVPGAGASSAPRVGTLEVLGPAGRAGAFPLLAAAPLPSPGPRARSVALGAGGTGRAAFRRARAGPPRG